MIFYNELNDNPQIPVLKVLPYIMSAGSTYIHTHNMRIFHYRQKICEFTKMLKENIS